MNNQAPWYGTLEVHPPALAGIVEIGGGTRFASFPAGDSIRDASTLGYRRLRFGGEHPLRYPALHFLSTQARLCGMSTVIEVPHGSLSARLLAELAGSIDVVAVTIPGRPQWRGRVRSSPRLRAVCKAGMQLAIVFKQTRGNINDLEWAARYAVAHDAAALWVRTEGVLEPQLAAVWMTVEVLREYFRGQLEIGFELPNHYCPPREADDAMRWQQSLKSRPETFSEVISPLVIDGYGIARPGSAAFPTRLALGDTRERPLLQLAEQWIALRSAEYARLYAENLERARKGEARTTKLYDLLAEEAGRGSPAVFAAAG
jgi:hypothetical protein